MWNGSIQLVRKENAVQDKDGFRKESRAYSESIPANFTDVTRNDEILASQKGYTADQNIEIMECNYGGERCLLDESTGNIYDVKRTFRKDKSMAVILTCERRQNGTV